MGWFSHCPVSRAATGRVTSARMIRNMSASSKFLVSRQQPKDGERRLAPKEVHRVLFENLEEMSGGCGTCLTCSQVSTDRLLRPTPPGSNRSFLHSRHLEVV